MSKLANKNKNTSLKLTTFSLVAALLFSLSADVIHFFSHSDHDYCTETGTLHFHQVDLECGIYDFQLTPVLSFTETKTKPPFISNFRTIFPPLEENFFNTTTFQIQLRGPPESA